MNKPDLLSIISDMEAVLCDPEGRVCIEGGDGDRAILQECLRKLYVAAKSAEQPYGGHPDAKAASGFGSKEQPSTKEQPVEITGLLDDAIELLEIGHGGGYPEEVYESVMERYGAWRASCKK